VRHYLNLWDFTSVSSHPLYSRNTKRKSENEAPLQGAVFPLYPCQPLLQLQVEGCQKKFGSGGLHTHFFSVVSSVSLKSPTNLLTWS
jgi:hypothetical protein